MQPQKVENTDTPAEKSPPDLSEDKQRQAYIEERIRLGLAEQTRIRTQWEAEDRSRKDPQTAWKKRIWAITKGVGVLLFAFTFGLGWILTLWQPPSVEVLINYLCVVGVWMAVVKLVRWCSPFSPTRRIWKPILLVGSFFVLMALQVALDHSKVTYQYENGATVIDRLGRVNALWDYRRVVMPGSFSSLHSMHGPINRLGHRHGKWTIEYHTLPSKTKWYWENEEVSEQEWRRLVGA